jgi:hypothetical protein
MLSIAGYSVFELCPYAGLSLGITGMDVARANIEALAICRQDLQIQLPHE